MTNRKLPASSISRTWRLLRWLSVSRTMYIVVLALLLPTGASIYFFGYYALKVISVCVVTAVVTEFLCRKLRRLAFLMDGSAIVTGLILALTLPPTLPLWMAALGSFFAIAIAKEAFGGLGQNIFNPAMAGRAFLQVSFTIQMTKFVYPTNFNPDAYTYASPLNEDFFQQGSNLELYREMFLGHTSGSLGETSDLLILIAGVLLIALRVIDWRAPLVYLGTVALFSFALGQDPIYQILSGGLMLGAFFIVTDYVTSPFTRWGKFIFSLGAGILTVVIRLYGSLPEGVCFSILCMNALTPLIDRYITIKPLRLRE